MTQTGFYAIPGLEGVEAWRPANPLRVVVGNDRGGAYTGEQEARWSALCAANPRVYDGPILAVDSVDHARSMITCRRERYKRLAVQDAPAPGPGGVWLLGVKGWITARDTGGGEHLLIARRGEGTRIYAGLWECAPAGGVDPPREGASELTTRELAETLVVEAEEELGIELDARNARVLGMCRDWIAGSDDIVVGVELAGTIDPRRAPACQHGRCGWEYSDTAWLSREDAPGFDGRRVATMVPPARAMLRVLGWV